jgi:hypothetical protein
VSLRGLVHDEYRRRDNRTSTAALPAVQSLGPRIKGRPSIIKVLSTAGPVLDSYATGGRASTSGGSAMKPRLPPVAPLLRSRTGRA